jgi:antitoxin component of MazEF toxin-antitoxin module
MMTTTRVLRWGHGLGVRIPMALARKVGLVCGADVDVRCEDGCVVIMPLPRAPTLDELLARVTSRNIHREVDWWAPDGGQSPAEGGRA